MGFQHLVGSVDANCSEALFLFMFCSEVLFFVLKFISYTMLTVKQGFQDLVADKVFVLKIRHIEDRGLFLVMCCVFSLDHLLYYCMFVYAKNI